MEKNKINVAELLKDCPSGMELDCTMYDDVKLDKVWDGKDYSIKIVTKNGFSTMLTKYGQNVSIEEAKCVIFPKGKTTWEGFVPPCQFKDGDIVYTRYSDGDECIFIFENITENTHINSYLHLNGDDLRIMKVWFTNLDDQYFRLATEEEKARLFQAIKDYGYKWNEGTKTLEKLVEHIEDKGNISDGYHTFNELYEYRLLYNASMFNELAKQGLYDVHKSKRHSDGTIPFGDENWFIVQAELPTGQISNHYEMKDWGLFSIPEKEKANPYDGHTPQDVAKRLRDFLTLYKLDKPKFKVGDRVKNKDNYTVSIVRINDEYYNYVNECGKCGVIYIKSQDNWELVPNKFDISTLVPFESLVLARDKGTEKWKPNFWGFYDKDNVMTYPYECCGNAFAQCIPYEGNEHLLGKIDDCDEFYKIW